MVGASLELRTSLSMGVAIGGGLLAYSVLAAVRGEAAFALLSHMAILDGFVVMGIITVASVWRQRASEKALTAARAQSRVLQAQINPHFFFNTLNTISSLIPVDPHAAQQTVGRLADMSRYAFSGTERQKVALAEEIEFVRAYLEIEHARFGDRLRFELPCSAQMEGLELPPLIIQPLVENAVRHGIARRADGGAVSVHVHRDGPHFVVVV
jgi:two-component system sensor histidine kinase AlgZ